MEPRSHRWRSNGLEHHVLEWGQGEGAPATALVIHGFADAAATWGDVAEVLAASGLRVLAPDMRGFGDGARVPPGGYYYFPDYVADVAGIVQGHAGDAPLFVVGHSMGSSISAYFAGTFPERVTKLALVDGIGPPDNGFDVAPVRMRRWIETVDQARATERTPMSAADAVARLVRFNPSIDEGVLARRAAQLSREVPGGVVWKHDPLHTTTSPVPFFAESYKAFLRLVTCPVLHVSGGPMGLHIPDEDERLACLQRLSRVTIDGGHALHWARPKELGEALVAFWREG